MSDDANPPRRRRPPGDGNPQPRPGQPRRPQPRPDGERPARSSGQPRQPTRRPRPEPAADPRAAERRRPQRPEGRPPARDPRQPAPDPRQRDPRQRDPRSAGEPRRRDPRAAQQPRRDDPPRQAAPPRPRPAQPPAEAVRRRPAPRPEPAYVDADGYEYENLGAGHADQYEYDDYDGFDEYDEYDGEDWDDDGLAGRGLMLVAGIVVVVLVAVGGYFAFGDQIRDFVDGGAPDYAGTGNGTEVLISIEEGDTGADVARTLYEEGVTKSFDAFYELLLANDMTFQPGVFSLQAEMSAQAVMNAFRDPTTRVTNRVVIREGLSAEDAFALLSETSEIPVAEFEAAAADLAALGIPAEAPSIEGFLFPATYEIEPNATAAGLVQLMVDKMISQLDAAGVAPEDRFEVVNLASIIQREAGSVEEDFYKVSRVFHNRLDDGMLLQSDATVAYGRGHYDSVFTTAEERADTSNQYNTYAHTGLPVGPIGLPGDLAIDAAANPVDGPWFYFVTVNLETGETKFSETLDQHNQAVRELQSWCQASEENASYCG